MRWSILLLLVSVTMLAGCSIFKGSPSPLAAAPQPWLFSPVVMRVHPFTTFAYDKAAGAYVLDARIELQDRVGDSTKGVGDFRFELYEEKERASQEGEEVRQAVWSAPMTTLEQNQQHYDPITRTYVFRLKLTQAPSEPQKYKLIAQFTDPEGRRLSASAPLHYKPAAGDAGHAPSK